MADQAYTGIGVDAINTPASQQLALEAAQQSMVLLQNNGALPLDASAIQSVAVIGPNGNMTSTMQANYYGTAPFLISPVQGIQSYVKSVTYTAGCAIDSQDTSGFAAAEAAAKAADAVVMIMGIDQTIEREGHDRDNITLPGVQSDLIKAVAAAATGPVIVVFASGSSLDVSDVKGNSDVHAMVWAGYPGQAGGQALADVIFGAYNPGGRLPVTWYPAEYANQVSMFDMRMRPSSDTPGRTYRFYTGEPVFPMGHGLSYTTFSYDWQPAELSALDRPLASVQASLDAALAEGTISLSLLTSPEVGGFNVTVTNTGKVAGSDAVIAYMTPPGAGTGGAPLKYVIGFDRVFLEPGESTWVWFPVHITDISLIDENGDRTVRAGHWTLRVGHGDEELRHAFTIA
jgi:hypothetical protein